MATIAPTQNKDKKVGVPHTIEQDEEDIQLDLIESDLSGDEEDLAERVYPEDCEDTEDTDVDNHVNDEDVENIDGHGERVGNEDDDVLFSDEEASNITSSECGGVSGDEMVTTPPKAKKKASINYYEPGSMARTFATNVLGRKFDDKKACRKIKLVELAPEPLED